MSESEEEKKCSHGRTLLQSHDLSLGHTSRLSSAARDLPSPNPSMIFLALLRYFLYFSISASFDFLASSREESWLSEEGRTGGRVGRDEQKERERRRGGEEKRE